MAVVRKLLQLPERDDDHEEPEPMADHAIYLSPWRERLIDGALSPWYGPMTEGEYTRRQRDYEESIWGGGLWDPDEEPCSRKERHTVERYDAAAMERFVHYNAVRIPQRELEVFFGYFRDRRSMGQVASQLGVCRATVHALVKRLRRRMRGDA